MQDLPCGLLCLNCLILQLVHKLTDACLNELCTVREGVYIYIRTVLWQTWKTFMNYQYSGSLKQFPS